MCVTTETIAVVLTLITAKNCSVMVFGLYSVSREGGGEDDSTEYVVIRVTMSTQTHDHLVVILFFARCPCSNLCFVVQSSVSTCDN